MSDNNSYMVFSGTATRYLAEKICQSLGCPLGELQITKFSDGEFAVSYEESIRGRDVFLVQSTFPNSDNLMELLLMIDAAKRASARTINAVIPYFGWARQDRKDKPRVSIGAKLVADLLSAAGVNRVITMDLHADQIQGFFNVPVDHLYASNVILPYLVSLKLDDLVIASPDVGGSKRANTYAKYLGCPLVLCNKTRARANVLREILTRGWGSEAFGQARNKDKSILKSEELAEVLDSCLACKGCRSECPSNVDMTRLRSEILQQKYNVSGMPLRSFAVSYMATVEQLGHIVWPFYNLFASWKFSSNIIKNIIKFSSERDIPTLSRVTMRTAVKRESRRHKSQATKGKVFLFADEFTNFQEAELGLTFAKLLLHLGYEVEIPKHVESGRAAISKGNLKLAKKYALKNVNLLKDKISEQTPLVGIEPSCILSFRDEYPDLVPAEMRQQAKELGSNALLFDEFIMREVAAGRITSADFKTDAVEIWLHGHCHQKALVGTEKTVQAFKLLSGAKIHVIPSGCCGMAGSFGYEKEHYKTSLAIGEMVLFPTIRKAVSNADGVTPCIVSAPGISCRQQILDGTGVHAVHPIEILYRWAK